MGIDGIGFISWAKIVGAVDTEEADIAPKFDNVGEAEEGLEERVERVVLSITRSAVSLEAIWSGVGRISRAGAGEPEGAGIRFDRLDFWPSFTRILGLTIEPSVPVFLRRGHGSSIEWSRDFRFVFEPASEVPLLAVPERGRVRRRPGEPDPFVTSKPSSL